MCRDKLGLLFPFLSHSHAIELQQEPQDVDQGPHDRLRILENICWGHQRLWLLCRPPCFLEFRYMTSLSEFWFQGPFLHREEVGLLCLLIFALLHCGNAIYQEFQDIVLSSFLYTVSLRKGAIVTGLCGPCNYACFDRAHNALLFILCVGCISLQLDFALGCGHWELACRHLSYDKHMHAAL